MSHLKRYSAPRMWHVQTKKRVWTAKPAPGPHPAGFCLPVQILLRNILKQADTAKEAKTIVKQAKVHVDKRPVKDARFPVGLMDVVEFPETKKYFRIVVDKSGLVPIEISAENANHKICMINNKRLVKGGLFQLNLHDGRNILTKDNSYKPGDSLVISLPDQKIIKHLKLEKGNKALIVSGRNKGVKGVIKEVYTKKTMSEKSKVTLEVGGEPIETPKNYVLVIDVAGAKKPKAAEAPKKEPAAKKLTEAVKEKPKVAKKAATGSGKK